MLKGLAHTTYSPNGSSNLPCTTRGSRASYNMRAILTDQLFKLVP